MGTLLESIFRQAGKTYGKARWIFKSLTGTEEESLEAEYMLGKILSLEMDNLLTIDRENSAVQLVEQTGERLYRRLANKKRKFSFSIFDSEEINAFALPGGFIFLTNSLVRLFGNAPGEIAFVLGHEMGHVVKGHALDRIVAEKMIGIISNLSPGRGVLNSAVKNILTKFLYSAYTQDQELEADAFGIKIIDAAGFPPEAAVSAIRKLSEIHSQQEGFPLEKYFASHPKIEIRLQRLNRYLTA